MRVALALIASLAAATAAAQSPPSIMFGPSGITDYQAPVRSMEDLKFAGVVRQRFDFSCGSAALATLLRLYGDAHGESRAFRGMWAGGDQAQIRRLGFSLLDMKRYLDKLGRSANGYKVTLEQVEKTGLPGIALIAPRGYRHFVVVLGVRNGEVLVGDPSLGLRVERAEEFKKNWNGVYFAIDANLDQGRAAWNRDVRWAAYPRAPVGSRFADPLSIQALALTAPFYRDF